MNCRKGKKNHQGKESTDISDNKICRVNNKVDDCNASMQKETTKRHFTRISFMKSKYNKDFF
jgi:hypothetical protein